MHRRSAVEAKRTAAAVATLAFLRAEVGFAAVLRDHDAVEVIGDLDQRGTNRLAGRRILLVGEIAAESAAIQAEPDAATRTAPLDRARIIDFTGRCIDDADVDREIRLGLLAADGNAANAETTTGIGRV